MPSPDRPGKRPARSVSSQRPRRRPASAKLAATPAVAAEENEVAGDGRNVGSLEGAFSLALGVLLVVAALFPKSFKQLLLLGIGSGLAYRGMKGYCGLYEVVGINTTKDSLKQIGNKVVED